MRRSSQCNKVVRLVSMGIVEDRATGLPYRIIAAKHGVSVSIARHRCKMAMRRGQVTAEAIGYKAQTVKRPHKGAYEGLYDKLVARIRIDDKGCWLWTGPYYKNRPWPQNRYGHVTVWDGKKYTAIGTHRAMMIAIHGPLTTEQCVCHRCDVPLCINPAHLFIGSMRDNIHDSRSKNRHHEGKKTHCDRGHPLSGDNLRIGTQKEGGIRRVCKTCEKIRTQWPEYRAKALERQRRRRAAHSADPATDG